MRVEFPQSQDQENIKVPYFELSKFKGSTDKTGKLVSVLVISEGK